mmetsp:Transcript_76287/g.220362  ORF Transcript_76287/g.220362 Transcript_76287/m.220362 type:complete len:242 (-) Transcript_76287:211-936(-)
MHEALLTHDVNAEDRISEQIHPGVQAHLVERLLNDVLLQIVGRLLDENIGDAVHRRPAIVLKERCALLAEFPEALRDADLPVDTCRRRRAEAFDRHDPPLHDALPDRAEVSASELSQDPGAWYVRRCLVIANARVGSGRCGPLRGILLWRGLRPYGGRRLPRTLRRCDLLRCTLLLCTRLLSALPPAALRWRTLRCCAGLRRGLGTGAGSSEVTISSVSIIPVVADVEVAAPLGGAPGILS